MRNPAWKGLGAVALVALGVIVPVGCAAVARVDEPKFGIEHRDGDFEVRQYGARVVAETRVAGSWNDAGNEGFRRLAGYIFGSNRRQAKLAMTAPVGQRADSRKLAMTAPVAQKADGDAWTVSFTMPEGETLATLPEPIDPRVTLREVPGERVAVVRYSGRWTTDRVDAQTRALRAWVGAMDLHATGEPEVNRYDPPWTLWFLRRNEIWLRLAPPTAASHS
jgi:hypothetical protein